MVDTRNIDILKKDNFLYDVILFDKCTLHNKDVDFFKIVSTFYSKEYQHLQLNELSIYLDMKNYMDVLLVAENPIKECFDILKENKKLLKDSNVSAIIKIVKVETKKYNLNVNPKELAIKLLIICYYNINTYII